MYEYPEQRNPFLDDEGAGDFKDGRINQGTP